MDASGWQHISKSLGGKDTQSLQRWLARVGASMPDIDTVERKIMEAQKPRYVPQELKGRIVKNRKMDKPTSPQWVGEIMFKGQHIRFSVWENDGEYGKYFSIKVSDPDWQQQQRAAQYPKDVTPGVRNYPQDSDVPF